MKRLPTIVSAVLLLTALNAQAKTKTVYVYIVDGREVTASEALSAGLAKKAIMKCSSVALQPSKSGTSFSLKAVKATSDKE